MARGTQLSQLVVQLRHEIGDSVGVNIGRDKEDTYKNLLNRVQEELYDDYSWPHLISFKSKPLAAGQRYYDFPTGMEYEGVIDVSVIYSGEPHDVARGIGFIEYASYNSDDDERADPLLAWDVRDVNGAVQFEAWPLPASNDMVLWFKTKRAYTPMVSDSDTAILDDRLITLFAAAEILDKRDDGSARAKLAKAQGRLISLRKRTQGASNTIVMGGGGQPRDSARGHVTIRVK